MSSRYRYQEVASFIAGLVGNGTLEPGSRVPSLREISRQQQISISTALQAYRLLEDRSVLEARPQSGYYVAQHARARETALRPAQVVTSRSDVSQLLECLTDPRLVPLGCATPDPKMLAAARIDRFLTRAARISGERNNRYTTPQGTPRLRQELARRAMRWGQVLSPDDIVITSGCTEALTLALRVVARPGDAIGVESPTYFGFLHMLEALNLRALELPTDAGGVVLSALAKALEGHCIKACLLSSSFQNPLGFTPSNEKKTALLRLLAAHQVPLIEDDIYGDTHFGKERPVPYAALDQTANTLYCSSFSKTVAPGYRIGWIASRRYMQPVLERKLAFTLSGPALPQIALADFLVSGRCDRHLRTLRRTAQDTMRQMVRTIEAHFPHGTRITHPTGGFLLWLELPGALRSRELFDAALSKGICFAPGDVFSSTGRYGNCMRLSFGNPWQPSIEQGVITLGQMACAALAKRPLSSEGE